MHHKHVVLSMGTALNPDTGEIMLVMEHMKHGSLQKLLFGEGEEKKEPPTVLKPLHMIQIALDVAKGLNYLHNLTPRIAHRDLKCANILVRFDT